MLLTQKNRLRLNKEQHDILYKLAFHSARLYNVGLYSVRQYYFDNNEYLTYAKNYHACKDNENYKLLLSDTSQQLLRLVDRNMKSFFSLLKLKQKGKYSEKIRLPKYKKSDELSIIVIQGRSARIKNGSVYIGLSKAFKEKYKPKINELKFKLPPNIKVNKLQEVRIIPSFSGKVFDIEFVYKKEFKPLSLDKSKHLSIDLGLNNFATCFNSVDGSSFIIDGKYIKSVNRRYNKERSRLQSIKDLQKYKHHTRRMINLELNRYNKLNNFFNLSVKHITDFCKENNIGTLVIGDFSDIKREINLGKINNQNFVSIPYGKFKQKLSSKCEQLGIEYHLQDESYTSKCSFLDKEQVIKHTTYKGKRIKRGLFKTSTNQLVNADVNGSANILYKFLESNHRVKELNRNRVDKGLVTNPIRLRLVA